MIKRIVRRAVRLDSTNTWLRPLALRGRNARRNICTADRLAARMQRALNQDSGDSWEIPDFPLKAHVWGIRRPETRSRLGAQLPVQADLLLGEM